MAKNELIKEDTKGSDTEDNGRGSSINLPKISGESTTEKQQRNLQHQWQRRHYMVKAPRDDSTELPLSTLATFDSRPSHADD